MTDARLRDLERAARHDPSAAEAHAVETIRAGGRDPRRDPHAGDNVAGRIVVRTWPAVLTAEVHVRLLPAGDPTLIVLPQGTLIHQVAEIGSGRCRLEARQTETHDVRSHRAVFGADTVDLTVWRSYGLDLGVDWLMARTRPTAKGDPAGVRDVEYWAREAGGECIQRHRQIMLGSWRDWAKRRRVLRVAP